MNWAGVNHGQTLIGHHGFGVCSGVLRERGFGTGRPRRHIGELALRKEVNDARAVDTPALCTGKAR